MENMNAPINVEPALSLQSETSRGFEPAEMYTLTDDKLSRNQKKIERRQFKNRISDRRSQMRLAANGDPQPDRRMANRIAYAEMYSRLKRTQ
ncbi:MAG: hypothetical protein ACI9UN_001511 [Granulosicoccus sp.]|jgi:hypothetical protein